jgi:hypothetical protein
MCVCLLEVALYMLKNLHWGGKLYVSSVDGVRLMIRDLLYWLGSFDMLQAHTVYRMHLSGMSQ